MASALERDEILNDESCVCLSDWASEACCSHQPSARCFYLSALGSLVLPSACSGPVGLLHQREKSNIFSSVPKSLAFKQTREMHKFSQGLEPE